VADPSPRLPGFEKTFAEEGRRLFVERARFLLWAALALFPAFWVLDLLVAREEALRFLLRRSPSSTPGSPSAWPSLW
jgi:hypothetical protein